MSEAEEGPPRFLREAAEVVVRAESRRSNPLYPPNAARMLREVVRGVKTFIRRYPFESELLLIAGVSEAVLFTVHPLASALGAALLVAGFGLGHNVAWRNYRR